METFDESKRKALEILQTICEFGPKWKSLSGQKHLNKRKERGHLSNEFTLNDYNQFIVRMLNKPENETYVYYKTSFEQRYFVFGDHTWVVIIGENNTLETAFPPDNYHAYLTAEKGYVYLGTVKELNKSGL